MTTAGWQFWIDRGGTFTDVVGCAPDRSLHSRKLLSANPGMYHDAAAEGIRRLLAEEAATSGGSHVREIRMGTTVATNALLERKGASTGLIMTSGFGDALHIGEQDRPRLFDLHIRKPKPLFAATAEAAERLTADGTIDTPLDTAAVRSMLSLWREQGIESVAVCLLHAWLNPVHEQAVAALARESGFAHVYCSHEVSPLMKYVARAGTTVADAYLSPVLLHYVAEFQQELAAHGIACDHIYFMQSHGGLVSGERFRGKDAILSGPAGGVIGMRAAGNNAGADKLIGFDMGGTSTDVSVCDGDTEVVTDTEIGGVHIRTPMIRIHTIAAGGGSLLNYDNGRFVVGPESAGAAPGPLSYGRGGPLALTDANVLLGRIQAQHFPRVFGSDGSQPLDVTGVRAAFQALAAQVKSTSGEPYTPEQTAEGFLRVAVENMANALRQISVARGLDPATYTLCCFGGAGAQHACRIADRLGMTRILLDPHAGVLSAWGMGAAQLRSYRQRSIDRPLEPTLMGELRQYVEEFTSACTDELQSQGAAVCTTTALVDLKIANTDNTLTVTLNEPDPMRAEFAEQFAARFGYAADTTALHVDAVRVDAEASPDITAKSRDRDHDHDDSDLVPADSGTASDTARMYLNGAWHDVPVYARSQLRPGATLTGPSIISEANSTTVVEPGWSVTVNEHLQLLLTRTAPIAPLDDLQAADADPVLLEIINNRFVYVANEMGTALRKTAQSVNIKERLDFSCALFSADGDLIANAPHVPVHLGSMDDSVKSALRECAGKLLSGAVVISNAPYNGGTHLPDVTTISALVDDGEIRFVIASRAHHADIGGNTPGSMPPFSRSIHEEGVLFDHFVVLEHGELREAALRDMLAAGEHPARNPDQNVADFRAQIAANKTGRRLLQDMRSHFGAARVDAYAHHVQANAEEAVRQVIGRLGEGRFSYPLDSGQQISVRITTDPATRSAVIDFTGTSAATDNNLNAPRAVCQAAVMYVFRTLVQTDIPLNAGCRRPLQIVIPDDCMLNPVYPAAVVGGNVETSQCITDALYGALGVLAGSQGTMNNVSFGNATHQYYETVCGGSGAGPGFPGADAVQTHMTNTRITDPEVIETRYPVLLREFSIRIDSGGAGISSGGQGVVRKIEFREAMSAAVLSNNRSSAPFGLHGGGAGQPGRNAVQRRDGTIEEHGGVLATDMAAGDVLIIETPGGGGCGTPPAT